MKNRDIETKEDIKKLIDTFYEKVKVDKTIGFFFTEIAKVNWNKHIPLMYDFWENVLFHSGTYEGNPMKQHQDVNDKRKLNAKHFDHWILLFSTTVDENFVGLNAETIKKRASSIASVMQFKFV